VTASHSFDKLRLLSFYICGCYVQTQLIGALDSFILRRQKHGSVMDVLRDGEKSRYRAPIDTLPFFWKHRVRRQRICSIIWPRRCKRSRSHQ
jgi:hypothetical protein